MKHLPRTSFLSALAALGVAPVSANAQAGTAPLWHAAVFRFAPEQVATAVAAFRRMRTASRTHPGNLSYEVYRSPQDPQSFFIVEHWASADALSAHERTPIFSEVGRNILERYAELHDAVSGVPL